MKPESAPPTSFTHGAVSDDRVMVWLVDLKVNRTISSTAASRVAGLIDQAGAASNYHLLQWECQLVETGQTYKFATYLTRCACGYYWRRAFGLRG